MSVHNKQNQNQTRDMKHRVLTCLHKLSDRDTHSSAATELESIAKTLSPESIPPFISSIATTDSSDKSPVRKQCLKLISLISEQHGNSISPHLSKLLTAVVRRLRDPDSAVRAACISACASISSHLTKPPFSSIIKPFLEALFTEQEMNSQIGAALCLAAAIEASPDPDIACLRKSLPRFEKLLKSESFKAKAALLTLIGSVIGVGGASSSQIVRNLVPYLVEFVSSDDWAARKASAEALMRIAVVEGDALSEFKAPCLKTFEAKRFDKVKAVRETMNQMLEAWKGIPDLSDDGSPLPQSNTSSKENASDGGHPPGLKTSRTVRSSPPSVKRPANKSSVADNSTAPATQKGRPLKSVEKKSGPAIFRKLDRKKPWKVEASEDNHQNKDGIQLRKDKELETPRPGVKRTLFSKITNETRNAVGKAGSRVVPFQDEISESTVVVSNETGDLCRNPKDCEDLSLIRKQLVHIETHQSNLLELLQKFMGSSQSGMHSLETRVHGLELALDEISFDLAMSTGRMSNTNSATMCCKLPGAEFLTSKLWKRTEGRGAASHFAASGGTSSAGVISNVAGERLKLERRKYRLHSSRGFIVNPLAEIHGDPHGISEPSVGGVSKSSRNVL
ncbi:hypothetical protein RND71_017650 [Anisodus tanguticus]|uniref:TOG domain-containing protein n=1 Tax=Anisodus tanguticus TaxID=243964 RepID=A0AAE1VII6_9SOLA|nr:hypothetical protein RND71_017650 [Anisodus tanguticus]